MNVVTSASSLPNRRAQSKRSATVEPALSLYRFPPSHNVSIDEFEKLAIQRLQLLRTIEALHSRNIKGTDFKQALTKAQNLLLPMGTAEERMADNTSHFVLRLAYCKSEDLRRWFLQHECDLFRFRFQHNSSSAQIDAFMRENNLGYSPITHEEKRALREPLRAVYFGNMRSGTAVSKIEDSFSSLKYYKVPFSEVLSMVSRRQVYIHDGFAYVPRDSLITLLQGRFRASLSKELATAFQALPQIYDDKRIAPLLRNISKLYVGKDYNSSAAKGEVKAGSIDGLVTEGAMPACMSELHNALKRDHHLRHAGRMQYGLFLKGIGLSLEDALIFWQREFTKKVTLEVFNKQYAYNIRHNYGKEGKRADYSPYSCQKIILGAAPGHGEFHGCPYKEYDSVHLTNMLRKMKIGSGDISDIVETAQRKDSQLACRKQFEARHKRIGDDVGNHPNAFFEASQMGKQPGSGDDAASNGHKTAVPSEKADGFVA